MAGREIEGNRSFRPGSQAPEPVSNHQLAPGTPIIEIARSVAPQSILLLARLRLGLPAESLIPFGHFKAKVDLSNIDTGTAPGKLVLATAVTPTPAGEDKTTTSVGLNDALNLLVKNSMVCLREPSLGPCVGMKGGAAGPWTLRALAIRASGGVDTGKRLSFDRTHLQLHGVFERVFVV